MSDISLADVCLTEYDNHIVRTLSSMKGQYLDQLAYEAMLREKGDEFFMTKGHVHSVLETAEVYYCLQGKGVMVMETHEGKWAVEELRLGRLLHVPPRWAHRSVNTGASQDLVTLFIYPANAGHNYGAIEQQGMHKSVVERKGRPEVIDNPRWKGGK